MHRDSRISQFPNGQPAIFFKNGVAPKTKEIFRFGPAQFSAPCHYKRQVSGGERGIPVSDYLLLLIFFNNLYNINSFCLYDSFCDLFPQTRKQTCKIFAYADNK